MKDNFSLQASEYAQFRPGYPAALFNFLYAHCARFDCAWDCATGNGQMAAVLAERFAEVDATDISEKQLRNALPKPNVSYRIGSAESSGFPDQHFDLVTVGQAAHWFDFDRFYPEVQRVIRPGGLLALVGYNLLRIDAETDALVDHFYHQTLKGCWDAERRLVETNYATLPFPFDEIPFPEIASEYVWNVDQLLGYLSTWSAVQHFLQKQGYHPIDANLITALKERWPEGILKTIRFPIFGRVAVL